MNKEDREKKIDEIPCYRCTHIQFLKDDVPLCTQLCEDVNEKLWIGCHHFSRRASGVFNSLTVKRYNGLTQQQEAGNGAKDKGEIARLHRVSRGTKIQAVDLHALEHERGADTGRSACEDSQLHAKDGLGRRAK